MSHPPSEKYCVVRARGEGFAVPASAVREVLSDVTLVPLPHISSLLAGVCHVRSEFLPVIRLSALFDPTAADSQASNHVVIVQGHNGPWALLVDEALALTALEPSLSIEPPSGGDAGPDAVIGTATFGDRIVRVLDVSATYRWAEKQLKESSPRWPPVRNREQESSALAHVTEGVAP
jgi:chemotaxis signal transduction protein